MYQASAGMSVVCTGIIILVLLSVSNQKWAGESKTLSG